MRTIKRVLQGCNKKSTELTFLIIVVGIKDKLENYVHLMKEIISDNLEGHIIDVHYTPCDPYQIQKYLESSCNANKANIIMIIGEPTKCKSIEENVVCLATKVAIRHCNNIYKDIKPDILELEVQLKNVFSQAVCGIRNNTLILNMFGICLMATMCLRTHKEKILQIAQKMMQINTINSLNINKSFACNISSLSLEKIDWLVNIYKKTPSSIVTVPQAILTIGSIISKELRHHKKSLIIPEYVSVHDAYGKILFENIYSECNVPSARVSAKEGFAIIINDEKKIKKILDPEITSVQRGTCVMVNIGTPIPDGATAVVEIKNVKKIITICDNIYNPDNKEFCEDEEIEILSHPKEEENIKPIGYSVKMEELILSKNTRIGTAEIGILTCCGIDKVAVIKHQSVGILSIGDELEEPGKILKPGHIYDSSKLILITLLKQHGFDALNLGIAKDNIISIISKIEEILEKVNVIVIIGAAKDKDLLKPILRGHFNAVIHFGAVNMKPGKSTTYATCTFKSTTKHFLCLSKNSAIVPIAAHLFLLPLLNVSRCFHKEWPLVISRIQLAPELYSRPKYVWTSLKWNKENTYPWVHNISNHYNHNTNALLRLPPRTMEMSKLLPDAFITTIFELRRRIFEAKHVRLEKSSSAIILKRNKVLEVEMTFTFRIVVVCNLEERISPIESCHLEKKPKFEIKTENDIISLPNKKDKLMKYLMSTCDKNEVDVIIVTSNIDYTVIFDVSEIVMNKNVFTKITTFISKLEMKLKHKFNRVLCGVRKQTLILNIYGSPEVATECIEKHEVLIYQIVQLIQNKTSYGIITPIEVIDAQITINEVIIRSNKNIESECVSVQNAYGRVLLEDIHARCNVPSFRTSAKYGYAIIADEKNQKKIVEAKTISLTPDVCVAVKTGTPIPNEATAVVKIKDTKIKLFSTANNNSTSLEDIEEEIEIITQPKVGENIRPVGYKIKVGQKVLKKYTRIGLAEIECLISCGINEIIVIKHQSIGILSVGNELGDPGEILRPKHNYDGNRLTLITLLKQEGFDALDLGIVNDDMLKIIPKIQNALEKVNILVTTGSANGRNRLKHILQEFFKAIIHFDYVNVKPGKSTTYATCMFNQRKKHFLCFSGNPTKVLIGAHLFLLPLLNQMSHNNLEAPIIQTCVINKYKKNSRPTYTWTHLKWDKTEKDLFAKAYSMEDKSNIFKYSPDANALLILPPSTPNDISHSENIFTPALFLQRFSK
ncbi:hypothetical protein ACFW04_006837 [Cataglyphis niger]